MPQATAISLSKFTSSVQAAVKSAAAKHPKFKLETPNGISISYLIRGFPLPDALAATVTLAEAQAFATEVAASLTQAHADILVAKGTSLQGAVISIGGHIIIGVPPATEVYDVNA